MSEHQRSAPPPSPAPKIYSGAFPEDGRPLYAIANELAEIRRLLALVVDGDASFDVNVTGAVEVDGSVEARKEIRR